VGVAEGQTSRPGLIVPTFSENNILVHVNSKVEHT